MVGWRSSSWSGLQVYHKQALPEEVWDVTGQRQLVVVTCGGAILTTASGERVFADNLVATFVPAD